MLITEQGADRPASNHLFAYTVQEYDAADGKKARSWTRIGVAFPHKDGTGFNVELHSVPLDGRIVLFPPTEDTRADDRDQQPAAVTAPPPVSRSANPRRNR